MMPIVPSNMRRKTRNLYDETPSSKLAAIKSNGSSPSHAKENRAQCDKSNAQRKEKER